MPNRSGRTDIRSPRPAKADSLGISILNNDGSIDGEFSDQDRLTAIAGRLANPKRANEIMVSSIVAEALSLHVGQVVPIGFYTNAQTTLPGYGTGGTATFKAKAHLAMDMKVVGIVTFNNQVVLDSLDATNTAQIVYTPALTHRLVQCCVTSTTTLSQACSRRQRHRRGGEGDHASPSGRFRPVRGRIQHRRGRAGHQTRVDRSRCVRGHRRPGHRAHRRSGHQPPTAPARRGGAHPASAWAPARP